MDSDIRFITLEESIEVHDNLMVKFGGLSGIRDKNLLESAIYQPQITIEKQFAYISLFQMAAAYAFGIIKNHPFIDGNKRTGLTISLLFLKINGIKVNITNDEFYELALEIATSKIKPEFCALFLQKKSTS